MATRSQLQFGYMNEGEFDSVAMIYDHWDGYPESRLLDINRAVVKAHESYNQTGGFSYRVHSTYPSDLSAFYILVNKSGAGGVEIDNNLHGDIEYLYQIWQDDKTDNFMVRILTTHQPEGEEYDPNKWKAFWDKPSVDKLRTEDVGALEDLIQKYVDSTQIAELTEKGMLFKLTGDK